MNVLATAVVNFSDEFLDFRNPLRKRTRCNDRQPSGQGAPDRDALVDRPEIFDSQLVTSANGTI
jgi:hypothetical protein